MGRQDVQTRIMWGNLTERENLEDLGVDWRVILKYISKKLMGRRGMDCSGSGQRQVADSCEYGDEPLGFIKRGEFLD
jgi:hypothetical protein